MRGGGSFNPIKRGAGGNNLSHAAGGGGRDPTSFEVALRRELEVLAIVRGGAKSFNSLKGWGGGEQNVLPCLEGGGRKQLRTRDFPIL